MNKKTKKWIAIGAFTLLKMAIAILFIREIWIAELQPLLKLLIFFLTIDYLRRKWYKTIQKATLWAVNKIENPNTKRKKIDIGYKAQDKHEIQQLEERIQEIKQRGQGVDL